MDEPEAEFELRDGTRVFVRGVAPGDKPLFLEAMRTASAETLRRRFGTSRPLSEREIESLTIVDGANRYAVGDVERAASGHETPAGVARYVRIPDRAGVAEVAVAVGDRYQGQGLGSHLVRLVIDVARAQGIRRLEFHVFPDNTLMQRLIADLEGNVRERRDGPMRVYTLEL